MAAAAVWWLALAGLEPVELRTIRRVLAVYAHPDDEVVPCGATLAALAGQGAEVTLLVLTRGEKGRSPGAGAGVVDLGSLRARELAASAAALGIRDLRQWRFPDGGLSSAGPELRRRVAETLEEVGPDLVISHDPSGLYGHPDHVATALLVEELTRAAVPPARLWQVALPRRLRRLLAASGALPREAELPHPAAEPNLRVALSAQSRLAKARAWRAHRSQRGAIGQGWARSIPTWPLAALMPAEHFAERSPT